MYFHWAFAMLCIGFVSDVGAKERIPALNSNDPGPCNSKIHGKEVLVKDRTKKEIILICLNDEGVFQWKPADGTKNTAGEFFNPGNDCTDILEKREDAENGFYWITLKQFKPQKVWCDMTTDGGGFMLIGRKNTSETWTVPSNNATVEPYGEPHWSSSLGDTPIVDFRVQMATSEDMKATKGHWSYRLRSPRALKKLMMTTAGCAQRSAGIGDIAYVKDLLTEKIVTTQLRCSRFGFAHDQQFKFGWHQMNSCLKKPCPYGFAFLHVIRYQVDNSGGFSFSTSGAMSGMQYNATAFVGCDNGQCCGCFGPKGGTKDYCAENCKAINGGFVTKNVFTWFWVRSSLPKKLWKKCMEYQVKREDGKLVPYKLVGHSAIPVRGSCRKNSALLHDGIVVVPDSSTAQKVPAIEGLLEYRQDRQQLYVRSNETWNAVAQEKKITEETDKKYKLNLDKIETLRQSLTNEKNLILQEMNKNHKLNLNRIKMLEQNLAAEKKIITQLQNKQNALAAKVVVLPQHSECFGYNKWLTESNRNMKYSSGSYCDSGLSTGWYRFGGGAGTKLPTSCVSKYRCGTSATGWMNGAHPSVAEGKVTRKVCYNWDGNCCNWSNNIEVVNCGLYYVYKLGPTPSCNFRYCGSDN